MTSSSRRQKATLIDIPTLADQLGTTPRHIRRLVAERRIPYLKIGALVRFDPADVDEWLGSRRQPPSAGTTPRQRSMPSGTKTRGSSRSSSESA